MNIIERFGKLLWFESGVKLGNLDFQIENLKKEKINDNNLIIYKNKDLIDEYKKLFSANPKFKPDRIFELGIWQGGGTVFWNALLEPTEHLAIDIRRNRDSTCFAEYASRLTNRRKLKTFWGVDQGDKVRLRSLCETELSGKLDLIFDDASHLYEPTLSSFEALFPLLNPGGMYIIEDWAWEHWSGFDAANHHWANEVSLTNLIYSLVGAAGTPNELIAHVSIYKGFVAVERGRLALPYAELFTLEKYIKRRNNILPKAKYSIIPSTMRTVKKFLRKMTGI